LIYEVTSVAWLRKPGRKCKVLSLMEYLVIAQGKSSEYLVLQSLCLLERPAPQKIVC
jgi:hypothetical protein